ncbi:TetR/AcrR family transcriptional regulator [Rhodococcus koreensis]|uniref:TetR/AcrR family transcriptional regulator n=1 Tax=Rhodococcus koreensis TaxID=99653 RepID=UPI00366CB478
MTVEPKSPESVLAPPIAPKGLLREPPPTDRGARRRAALIAAARTVFEREGYLNTRLQDITEEAQCSAGTFYTYFKTKEEIFAALLETVQEEMLHPGVGGQVTDAATAYEVLEASNRAYLKAYRSNGKLMGLLEEVALVDPVFGELRQRRADAFVSRNARNIADLQKRGIADPDLDPDVTARALSAMVSRTAYRYFAASRGRKRVNFDKLVETMTRIWANALQITP